MYKRQIYQIAESKKIDSVPRIESKIFLPELQFSSTNTTQHPLNGLLSGTTWVSWYQKGNTSLDLNEVRDYEVSGWQWHQLDNM